MSNTPYIRKHAELSPCGKYRYMLRRIWDAEKSLVHWVMLNPSTADAEMDDPTIRRCMGFAQAWGYGGIYVSNLFALRATDPEALAQAADPIGPECDRWIMFAANAPLIVCAWGSHSQARPRAGAVVAMLRGRSPSLEGRRLWCLGRTMDGSPRHPLYVKASQAAEEFHVFSNEHRT